MPLNNLKEEFKNIKVKMEQFKEEYKKKLLFLAFINKCLNQFNTKIIVLGGFAVQFYTAGEYLTKDIDLACDNRQSLEKLLLALDFEKLGRHYFSRALNLAIEIPTAFLSESEQERLLTVEIGGYKIFILGLEDIIIDRLNAFTHWQSLEDGRIAKELLFIHFDKIDWSYLEKRAQKERIDPALQNMKREVEMEHEG